MLRYPILVAALLCLLTPGRAKGLADAPVAVFADTIRVTTLLDAEGNDGVCALREAVSAANTNTAVGDCTAGDGYDVIDLTSLDGVISLSGGGFEITESLRIVGPGSSRLRLDGSDSQPTRIVAIGADSLVIEGVRLRSTTGIEGNFVEIHGLFYDNNRGGVKATTLVITSSGFVENALSVSASVIEADTVIIDDGALIDNDGTGVTMGAGRIVGSLISGNLGIFGGGIRSSGRPEIVDSSVSDNVAMRCGGGIYGPVELHNSIVSGNSVLDPTSDGGGICIDNGSLRLRVFESEISGNSARRRGGGIYVADPSRGGVEIYNSTVSGNSAEVGGGIYTDKILIVRNSTITNNRSLTVAGGIRHTTTSGELFSSIIAGNIASDGNPDFLGQISSSGHNLVGNKGSSTITPAEGDHIGTSESPVVVLLGRLDENGGSSQTHLPTPFSLAIDAGSCGDLEFDQRGFGNPETGRRIVDNPGIANAGDGCDVGAVEVGAVDPSLNTAIEWTPGGPTDPNVSRPGRSGRLEIFPNPAWDFLSIELETSEPAYASVAVFDILGRKVGSDIFSGPAHVGVSRFEWRPGELHPGVYFVRADLGSGGILTRKLLYLGRR